MASSKAPKHDFAPAWLKIPDHNNQKTPGAKSCEQADQLGYYGYGRRRDDMLPHRAFDYPYAGGVPRPRNFDQLFDDRHFANQLHGQRVGEEFYTANGGYGGYGPYRPTHPAARYNPNMNIYPAPYAYPYSDPLYSDRPHGRSGTPRRTPRKDSRSKVDKLNNSPDKEKAGVNKEKDQEKPVDNPPLYDDFPSLNGESEVKEEKREKRKPSAGVWDKNNLETITNSKTDTGKENRNNCVREVKHNTNIYKALVPSKSKIGSKRSGKETGGKLTTISNRDADINSINTQTKHNKMDSSLESSTAPMDIPNKRRPTCTQIVADKKKCDILKRLKQDNNDLKSTTHKQCLDVPHPEGTNGLDVPHTEGTNGLDLPHPEGTNGLDVPHSNLTNCLDVTHSNLTNGFFDLELSPPDSNGDTRELSKSLEEEVRFLRKLGWSEDDQVAPISDEEIKQIKVIIKQQTEKKNGFKKAVPITWSNPRAIVYDRTVSTQSAPVCKPAFDTLSDFSDTESES